MATHEVRVDFAKTLAEEPETGHNRWHPDIPPIVRCEPGDEVVLQTRDASTGRSARRPPPRRSALPTSTWSIR